MSASFATTRWTLVLDAARDGDEAAGSATRALGELCSRYRPPLRTHALRRGLSEPDADDAVQAFFARLLRLRSLASLGRGQVRFRAWMLGAFNHHLADLRDHALAAKRGAGRFPALDQAAHDDVLARAASAELPPDRAFDRSWAHALLQTVADRLEAEHAAAGHAEHFGVLFPAIAGRRPDAPHAEIAARLRLSEQAVRSALVRLRRRYRHLLREEIARTVADPAEVDDELRHLFASLSPPA